MISAVSGLPDLILEKQNDVQIDIEFNRKQQIETAKQNLAAKSEVESSNNKYEQKEKKYNQESIDELNNELGNFFEGNELNVEFRIEKDTRQLVMKLVDNETKEVVKQLPPEFMLKIARMISSQIDGGALADAKV
jgi:flagellar protein FlaG